VVVLDFELTDEDCEVGAAAVEGAAVAGTLGAATVGFVAGAVTVGHDSDSDRIGSFTGNDNDDNGVPGGTSIVNGIWTPPSSVTVTTHSSADAAGNMVRPSAPAAMTIAIARREERRARIIV